MSAPLLRLPNLQKTFMLRTDASNIGIGACLLQYDGEIPYPISYASGKLKPAEVKYSTIEKECLSLVWAVERYSYYLQEEEVFHRM